MTSQLAGCGEHAIRQVRANWGIDHNQFLGQVCDTFHPTDRVWQVIEDPREERDVESLQASLRQVIKIQYREIDAVARPASVLGQEVRLVDPLFAHVKAESLRRSE